MKTILKALVGRITSTAVILTVITLFGASSALAQSGHFLVAHYTFDDPNNLGNDVSTNGNSFNGGSGWANSGTVQYSTNAVTGGGAALFDGGESIVPYQPSQPYDNWMAMFYGSFSISLWLNTSTVIGNDSDTSGCCNDPVVIWAYNYTDGVNPIMLTGTKVGFFTSDSQGNGDMLHSTNDVTTGHYVHVVVTRNQATGEKKIYVNGLLDSSDVATTDHLIGNTNYYDLGGVVGTGYAGLVDDVQLYDGVIGANDVAYLYANPGTALTNAPIDQDGLAAHYDFNESTQFAADLSGNGNNIVNAGDFGGPSMSTNATLGFGTVYFNGGSFLSPSTNLMPTLAGNFSLSLWVSTTQSDGYDGELAWQGAGIFSADVPDQTNDILPMALAGGGIGFNVGNVVNGDSTLNSTIDINDGNFHHIVVTRDEASGDRQIYIDGTLNATASGDAGLLNAPNLATIGAISDASQTDPTTPTYYGNNGFIGYIGDIQMYSRVISSDEVSDLDNNPGSTVGSGLVVHYDFDEGTTLAPDVSGNGNDMLYAGNLYYNASGPQSTTAQNGAGAVQFAGDNFLVPEGGLPSTLAGDFSVSVWLQTTQSFDSPGDYAYNGAGVVTAEVPWQYDDSIPVALNGGFPSFEVDGNSTDLVSANNSINDGNLHQVVVTRNQSTGEDDLYIDGALNSSGTDDGSSLTSPQILVLGALADASSGDPHSPTFSGANGYVGLMGDLQVYSRAITASEVSYLYANPGMTLQPLTNTGSSGLGVAVGASNMVWTTSGDASWFPETTNTYSTNAEAAQSGSLQDDQSSILQTTVTGPGTISFYWETLAGNDDFDLEFDIDGNYQDDISGQTSWTLESFGFSGSGTHTLTWNANTLGDYGSSPNDAGFLDQVTFTPAIAPVITVQPFSQTNYPGYNVALFAAATGTPEPTWQWYQVGNPSPLPNATSALFIPGNSGSSNVAGSYYAVASNIAGSQTTATATVSFVNAPLPPNWSGAEKSPFVNSNPSGSQVYEGSDTFYACLADATGTNIYATGFSSGTNYFGTNLITAASGENAAVIVKETTAGQGVWLISVTNNGNGNAYCEDIAPAPNGGFYAAIVYSGTNWIGSTPLQTTGVEDVYLGRWNTNGNLVWSQKITSSNGVFMELLGVTSDASGNVTLACVANGTAVSIGGTNIPESGQTSILAQFNSSGTLNWVETLPNLVMSLQSSGGVLYASLVNWLSGNTNYTVGGLTNDEGRNYTFACLNATNGRGIWLRDVGEAFGVFPTSGILDDVPLITASSTNVFLVGTAYGSNAVFGSYTVPISDGRGQYFARFDTNGNAQLASGFGSSTTQPESVTSDTSGNVYVTGNFDTYALFGEDIIAAPRIGAVSPGYNGQGFAAEFNRNGDPLWAREAVSTNETFMPDTDFVGLWGLTLTPNGLTVCGVGSGSVYFGTNLVNTAREDIYIGDSYYYVEFFDSGLLGMINLAQPPAPVTLLDPAIAGGSFQFNFLSIANHTNYVEYSTNLASGVWANYMTIPGDGTTKVVTISTNNIKDLFFRVTTQ